VVSALLTPEQAVKKALAVGAAIPQLAVVGIAGPGDPLANPERTFATCRALSAKAPDIALCISTNGLVLPQYVDELVKHRIDHVTITINCVDPDIGMKIYPWIFWNHRRIRGRKAAEILSEQQLKGLEMLAVRGVLVKINSVLIPGINDAHLPQVNRIVKDKGAFLHNIVPLIARPEHGTFYGVSGQREPSFQELQALQNACGSNLRTMRHCRQCRSDAIGRLDQDRRAEFDTAKVESMEIDCEAAMQKRALVRAAIQRRLGSGRETQTVPLPLAGSRAHTGKAPPCILVAVASRGGGLIDGHFGHTREFLIYAASPSGVRFLERRQTDRYCVGPATCGEEQNALAKSIRALQDCQMLLCARIGYEPWGQLEAAGIQPNSEHALEPIEAAVMAVYREWLAASKLQTVSAALPASGT
jgi:nitrogen fixation protein NifB